MSSPIVYTAVYVEDSGGLSCWIEEIPGAISQGTTLDEARENLRDALTLLLVANRERAHEFAAGRPIIRGPLALVLSEA